MANHVYKLVELTGSSPTSLEEAIQNAIKMAGRTVRNLRWFEVVDIRGQIEGDDVAHYQVTLKVGFTIEPGE